MCRNTKGSPTAIFGGAVRRMQRSSSDSSELFEGGSFLQRVTRDDQEAGNHVKAIIGGQIPIPQSTGMPGPAA